MSFYRFHIVILIVLLATSLAAYSQTFSKVEHLQVEHGLSQSTIRDIFQDSRGFLWFATEDGLNMYDGYQFKVYNMNEADAFALPHNFVYKIFEDSKHNLWIGTRGGLSKYWYDRDNFTSFIPNEKDSNSLSDNYVHDIYEHPNGDLWIGTYGGGICLYNEKQGVYKIYDKDNKSQLSDDCIRDISGDSFGNLWIATTANGLDLYNPDSDKFITFRNIPGNNKSLADNELFAAQEIDAGGRKELWVGTKAGGVSKLVLQKNMHKLPASAFQFSHYQQKEGQVGISSNTIYSIIQDKEKQIWVGTRGGGATVVEYDAMGQPNFTTLQHHKNDAYSLTNDHIFKVYEDKSHVIWLGTLRGGLNKFDPNKERFKHYIFDKENPIGNIVISLFEEADKTLWVGTRGGGLSKYHFDEKTISANYNRTFSEGQEVLQIRRENFQLDPQSPNTYDINDIYFIKYYPGDSSKLFMGTTHGMKVFDKLTNQFSSLEFKGIATNTWWGQYIYCAEEDYTKKDSVLWIGKAGGILKLWKSKRKQNPDCPVVGWDFEYYPLPKANERVGVYALCRTSHNGQEELWVGIRERGLQVYKLGKDKRLRLENNFVSEYKNQMTNRHSLPNNDIMSFLCDSKKRMWIATRGGGFCLANRRGTNKISFDTYNKTNGLSSDVVYCMIEDHNGDYWLTTGNSLARFRERDKNIRLYDNLDGIQRSDLNLSGLIRCRDEKIIFGGIKGFNMFLPDNIVDNPIPPAVLITDFKLFNTSVKPSEGSVLTQNIMVTKEITLSYDQNFISFDFVALEYSSSEKNQYAYQLVNFDKDWIQCGTRRFANYTNLDFGEYVFRVKATNGDGIWNEEGTSVRIVIKPPFWWRPWFVALTIITVIFIIWLIFRLRIRSIKNKNLELENRVALRTQELRDSNKSLNEEIEQRRQAQLALTVAKEQTEVAYQAKSDFLAGVSHEIRTPMNAVMGFTDILLDKNADEALSGYLVAIKSSGENLLALINDILDLSKLDAGKMDMNIANINIRFTLEAIKRNFELLAVNKDVQFIVEISPEVPTTLLLDEVRIKQVALNLVGNAVKFTDNGYVKLSLEAIPSQAEPPPGEQEYDLITDLILSVQDTGIGIPDDQQQKVFDAFKQQSGQSHKYGGTGLGLSICKRIVEVMGGEISVRSQVGKGSTFTVFLHNIAARNEQTDTATAGSHSGNYKNIIFEKSTVLLIDDLAENRQIIRLYLEDSNIELIEAASGAEGIKQAQKHKPDLILLDILMPEMDGWEVYAALRSHRKTANIPVIAVTASSNAETVARIKNLAFNDYLLKPIGKSTLFSKLAEFLPSELIAEKQPTAAQATTDATAVSISQAAHAALHRDLLPLWQKVVKNNSIAMISDFAREIIAFGESNNIETLTEFGKLLLLHTSSFDIEKIETDLQRFDKLIDSLTVQQV